MRLYLDLDGVLSAERCYKAWPGEVGETDRWGGLSWSPELISRLLMLSEFGLELIWVTSWREEIREIANDLDLGWWGTGARILQPLSGELTTPSVYWKAEAIWADLRDYAGFWAWFDTGVEVLWEHPDYVDIVNNDMGFVPEILERVGITPEILVGLEIRIEIEMDSERS